jgi:hypothetical protein
MAAEPRNDAPLNGGGGADKIQPGAGSLHLCPHLLVAAQLSFPLLTSD